METRIDFQWTDGGYAGNVWWNGATALVCCIPQERESVAHVFEVPLGVSINYRRNPVRYSPSRIVHYSRQELSDAFVPYLVVPVIHS